MNHAPIKSWLGKCLKGSQFGPGQVEKMGEAVAPQTSGRAKLSSRTASYN